MSKFRRGFVTFGMVEENPVTGELLRIAAGHQVKQRPTVGQAVERSGLAGGDSRRGHARAQGNKKFQALGDGNHRSGNQPRIFAGAPGRDQDAGKTEAVRGLRNLLQIAVIHRAGTLFSPQVATITVGR